jgi:hypothetical protein
MAANTSSIDLSNFLPSYSPNQSGLIVNSEIPTVFNPSENYIEYTVIGVKNNTNFTSYNYTAYLTPDNTIIDTGSLSTIDIDAERDLISRGYNQGSYDVIYKFLNNELNSSPYSSYYIKSISSDRTEISIATNNINNQVLESLYNTFSSKLNSQIYFQDFYLNFGNNQLVIANNILINKDNTQYELLINLYQPLPSNLDLNTTLWIVTQVANPIGINVTFPITVVTPSDLTTPLKGPNFNLKASDQTGISSADYIDLNQLLLSSSITTQYSQLQSILQEKSIDINIDYTDFANFVHFSSAYSRLNNFYYKVSIIEDASSSLSNINSYANTNNSSYSSGSKAYYTNIINNTITNFDGYEYFLYFTSGSWAWPKSNTEEPYILYPTTSSQVTNWFTNILESASIYDNLNQDYLYYTIPTYLRDDSRNDQYNIFLNLIGQFFDNIWIYYKDVTELYNADNRLDFGVSKDLVANALKNFGITLYQNNFSSEDLYAAFLGYTSSLSPTTSSLPVIANSGQEYISNYITASYDASVVPLDDVNKEIYKRLYHNLPYLLKTKGTIPGLRALINCFGVPDTILRISEFGGRDKDTSTYDYFDQQYNYALRITGSLDFIITSFALNPNWDTTVPYVKIPSIQFRFKPDEYISSHNSQSLIYIIDSTNAPYSASLLTLEYTGSGYTSSSYGGSTYSSSYAYARLVFYPNPNNLTISASIYQPFFNGDWWAVQLDRTSGSNDTFNLYAGSKGYYDGYDGNQILHLASSSVSVATTDTPWEGSAGNVYFGRYTNIPLNFGGKNFIGYTGSLQEIRYWAKTGSVESFKDFVMNPHSIDYSEEENKYADYLAFRAPLGSELEIITASFNTMKSIHPKVTGSWITTSSFSFNSNYSIFGLAITSSNIESFFYDQPIVGIKNRVTDKIQIVSSSYPTGSVLSQYRSLEQTYPTLGSETPDINLLEVAFSPQNEINDDIISSLGYFNIGEYIGDPRQVSSSATTYPDLVNLSNNFFQKYFASYNLFDYIRLIKYFDNSLFKMIKDFVPARTSLTSGVVIKQHLLERNKYPQPQVEWEELDYSGSITTAFMSGGTGGTFDSYNFTGSIIPPTFINNTQSWGEEVKTPVGLLTISHSTQDEFYNGELPNSLIIVTDGELNEANTIKYPSDIEIIYNPTLYISNITN